MKAVTVRLDGGGLEALLKRVRMAQELGFSAFDLCIANPNAPLERIVAALKEQNVGVTALRLKEERHSAMIPRKPGYAKVGSLEPAIAERSAGMVIETAQQLAPTRPQFLVIDGGFVQAPQLNERQLQLDDLLDTGDDKAASPFTTNMGREPAPASVADIVKVDRATADKQLENFCRGLHAITRAVAPLQICLLPPESPFGLLQAERMQHVLDDLKTVSYWHSTSHAAILRKLGGPDGRDWVQRFGSRLKGVYLEDMLGGHGEQAPGLGEIDFKALAPELAQNTLRVMVVDDDKGTKLRFGSEYLAKVGIF